MKACRVGGAESMRLPFDCPMDHVLDTPRWFEAEAAALGVSVREPTFLRNARVPKAVAASIAHVPPLPRAINATAVRAHLAPHAHAAVLVLSEARDVFCGFGDVAADRAFEVASRRLLEYKRSPFCYEDGLVGVPGYSQCCKPRKPGDAFFPCKYGFDPPEALPQCHA